jgi:hypothetical protein
VGDEVELTKDVPTFGGTFSKGTRLIIAAATKNALGKMLYSVAMMRTVMCGLPAASLSLVTNKENES